MKKKSHDEVWEVHHCGHLRYGIIYLRCKGSRE